MVYARENIPFTSFAIFLSDYPSKHHTDCISPAIAGILSNIGKEEMSHRLLMDCRTYIDLDQRKTSCSSQPLTLYQTYICSEPLVFLEELRLAFENSNNKAA